MLKYISIRSIQSKEILLSLVFVLFFSCFLSIAYAQPYLFKVEFLEDSANGFQPFFLNSLDLSTNSYIPFLSVGPDFEYYRLVPSNDWIILVQKYCEDTKIYQIADTTDYIDMNPEHFCFGGGTVYSKSNYKVYFFDGFDEGTEQLSSIDVNSKNIDSLLSLPYSYNQPLLNNEAFLSSDEHTLYFSVADTNYPPSVNDKDFVQYFSTPSNQITGTRRLSEFGYPDADGYLLHRGSKGKAIVESFYRNETHDSYYRLYDFDNDSGSVFIFHQGYTTPYFTDEGKYLILPETIDSSLDELNTGNFFVYDMESGDLIKTLNYPARGDIYTFDNYPNDIYYVFYLNSADPQPIGYNLTKLKLHSISPPLALPYYARPLEPNILTITVTGEFFTDSTAAWYNNIAKPTTFVSDSVVTFNLNSGEIPTAGNYPIWVSNYGSVSDTMYLSVANSLPSGIIPTFQCIQYNPDKTFTAHFGYNNMNDVSVGIVNYSDNNYFSPGNRYRGQPNIFLPGNHTDVFTVVFNGDNLTWTLSGSSITINKQSTPCN